MTRSAQYCLVLCAILFFHELMLEQLATANSSVGSILGPLSAQSEKEELEREDRRPERKIKPLSLEFFSQMKKFSEAYDEEDVERAREVLDRMLHRAQRWNGPEMAHIHLRYATVGFELEDMGLTVEHLKQILEYREHIQYVIEEQTIWKLVQIYTNRYEDYQTGFDYVQQWLDLKLDWEESAKDYAYIASIYTRIEDWSKSILWMKQAIAKEEESGLIVEKDWWMVLLEAYSRLAEEARSNNNLTGETEYLQEVAELSEFLENKYGAIYSRPAKNITAFSVDVLDSLAIVGDFIKDKQYEQAAEKLDELWQLASNLSPSEKAEIKYMSAGVAHHQGNIDVVVSSLESVLEYRENILYAREEEVLLRLSKLYFSQKEYQKAHDRLKDWLIICDQPATQDLVYAGKFYVQIRDFGRAKDLLQRAIAQQQEEGNELDSQLSELLKSVNRQLNIDN